MSDLLIFPLNLNFDKRLFSFRLILRKTVFSTILSIVMFMSANNPSFQSFVIAILMLSLGILIVSPTVNPDIAIKVLLFKLSAPFTIIPPIS